MPRALPILTICNLTERQGLSELLDKFSTNILIFILKRYSDTIKDHCEMTLIGPQAWMHACLKRVWDRVRPMDGIQQDTRVHAHNPLTMTERVHSGAHTAPECPAQGATGETTHCCHSQTLGWENYTEAVWSAYSCHVWTVRGRHWGILAAGSAPDWPHSKFRHLLRGMSGCRSARGPLAA